MRHSRWRWHPDEAFVRVNGVQHYLWRAVDHERVDHEGEVLEAFVPRRRGKAAALKFLRGLTKRHDRPEELGTHKLRSCGAALRELGAEDLGLTERWLNNRAENSHQPFRRRERAMLRFRRMHSLQRFTSVHSSVHDHFSADRSLSFRQNHKQARTADLAEWRQLCAD